MILSFQNLKILLKTPRKTPIEHFFTVGNKYSPVSQGILQKNGGRTHDGEISLIKYWLRGCNYYTEKGSNTVSEYLVLLKDQFFLEPVWVTIL